MIDRKIFVAACLALAFHLPAAAAFGNDLTLRALGAVGDGKTDDRAAIQAALVKAAGAPVDGEGATYAVHGNIELTNDVNLHNATLVQTMTPIDITKFIPSANGKGTVKVEPAEALSRMVGELPFMHASAIASYSDDPVLTDEQMKEVLPSISLRTLAVTGTKEKPVSVQLEKVKIVVGSHPQNGGGNAGGIVLDYASPVNLSDVEVTGDCKGSGIGLTNCSKIRLERLNIHDMNWAPYTGDNVLETTPLKTIKDVFGWNNFPIYKLDTSRKQFVRVRIQEQIAGLHFLNCEDAEMLDCKIARMQTKIGDRMYPLQADGVTVNNVKKFVVLNCHFSEAWEGIDFTGSYGDDFYYENCTASDNFTFGFKLAHPKSNGKMVNCISYRAGNSGFVMEPEMENIEFVRCHAYETGSNGYWTMDDGNRLMTIGGFRIFTNPKLPEPFRVTVKECTAVNTEHPDAMDFGFECGPGIDPLKREIFAIDCSAKGAKIKDIQGFVVK